MNITVKVLASITIFSVLSVRVSYTCSPAKTIDTYQPIYMSFDELRSPIKSLPAEPLKYPGEILFKGDMIYVNERYKGDTEEPLNLTEIARFPITVAQDIILYQNRAHIIGQNGLYQYDYSTVDNIKFLRSLHFIDLTEELI